MRIGLLVAAALLGVVAGCARASAPSGGDVPETPLRVVQTEPEALGVVRPFDGPVRIGFQRRLSERPTSGTLRDGVVVSPRTGSVEVRHRRRGIEVRMEGGFRDATIYRVTLLPVLQDRFQNRLAGPVDLYFSTGPDFEPNVLGGLVTDRLTGEEARGIRVDARDLDADLVHSTVADSTGIFTFSYLPAGAYRVTAYEDQNRNRRPDFPEPRDSMDVSLVRGDTIILTELALLPGDTTAPVLESAVVEDSVTLRLLFDDHLDPDDPLIGVTARLSREEGAAPPVSEILHRHQWEARRAAADEEEPVDDLEPPDPMRLPDPRRRPGERDLPEGPGPSEPGPALPARELVLILAEPLEPGAVYEVAISGVANIQGVPDGGGRVEVEVPPEPEEEPPEPGDAPPPS